MNPDIIFNLSIVVIGLLYLVFSKISLMRIMAIFSKVQISPFQMASAWGRNKAKLMCSIPFSLMFWLFVVCQAFHLMQYFEVSAFSNWGVCFFATLYGVYIIFMNILFGQVVMSYKGNNAVNGSAE